MGEVIHALRWRHKPTGRTASIYGAAPWGSHAEAAEWEQVQCGFTVRHPDGTIGIGRAPFATAAEAQAWADANPNFKGMQQD